MASTAAPIDARRRARRRPAGVAAPATAAARLREVLAGALRHGRDELAKPRSGYESPVEVAFAAQDGLLLAATPADAGLRADPAAAGEREWLLVAAAVATLVDLACPGPASTAADLGLRAGEQRRLPAARVPGRASTRRARGVRPVVFDEHGPASTGCAPSPARSRPACSSRAGCASRSARGTRCAWPRPRRGWAAS